MSVVANIDLRNATRVPVPADLETKPLHAETILSDPMRRMQLFTLKDQEGQSLTGWPGAYDAVKHEIIFELAVPGDVCVMVIRFEHNLPILFLH